MPYPGINTHSSGHISIDTVVSDVQLMLDNYDTRTAMRVKQFVIRGLNDLYINHVNVPKVKRITIPDSLIVDLPDDFIEYISVSFKNTSGQLVTLGKNKNLPPVKPNSIGSVVENETSSGEHFDSHPGYGHYGLSGGNAPSYFNIDYTNRVLFMNRQVPDAEIVLQYISSGLSIDAATTFNIAYREVLIAFALSKLGEVASDLSLNERMLRRSHYNDELKKVRAFNGAFTEQELRDVFAGTRKQNK